MAERDKGSKKSLKLLIVESPAKIKTIKKFLGNDFEIMSTFGHIKDLPSKKLGIAFDEKKEHLILEYVALKGKEDVIKQICAQAKKCDEIYLASDPDREGEIIAWHIGDEIEKKTKGSAQIYRITFNEITKPAITEAIEHKGIIDQHKVEAQQARRILDRWVGYEVSPILWKKVAKGLSAGRVQSVAVLLVCQREEEIVNFKPEESWSIPVQFAHPDGNIAAELFKINQKALKLTNEAEASQALKPLKGLDYKITSITEKKRLKNPLPPFMTSTLQQDAYNKLGFSVDKTMTLAQKLYEGVPLQDANAPQALITYMRTDSLRISDTALADSRTFIQNEYGKNYLPKDANFYGKKGAQDAHEAVRPVSSNVTPEQVIPYVERDLGRLYQLIWRRFIACQMSQAEYFQRQVLIDGDKYTFKATGSSLVFDGFLKVYEAEEDEEDAKNVKIPANIKKDDHVNLSKAEKKQHFTQPPAHYTEASLVKEMEKQGIGRPSTYAATLSTIEKRNYVTKNKKKYSPTELGKTVNDLLVKNLSDIINITFTAKMEEDLDKIAQGDLVRDVVLIDFYKKFQADLSAFGEKVEGKTAILTDIDCPLCQKKLALRIGKNNEFLGCTAFPECTFTTNFKRDENNNIVMMEEEQQTTDEKCPNCSKTLTQKIGRFGPFFSCPGYPECKFILQDKLKTPCPDCGKNIVKRASKRGSFWGCSGYPKCTFALFGDVEEKPCPECHAPFLMVTIKKDGGRVLSCSKKTCTYKAVIAAKDH